MSGVRRSSVLYQATESRKYPTVEKLVSLDSSDTCEIVVVGGHSHDGKGIMHCLGIDGVLRWNQSYPGAVTSVGVSGRGTYLGIGGVDNILYLFTGVGELAWKDDCRSDIKLLALSTDGKYVCVGLPDGNILYYNNELVAARKFAWKHRFDKPLSSMSMNNGGTMVAAGTEEGEISVFTERGDLVWTKLLDGRINAFKIAPEGDAAIVACSDNKARFYSAEIGKTLWEAGGGGVFVDADITYKGERAVAVSKDNHVYCYNKAGNLLWKYDLQSPGEKVRISGDGRTIVATSIDTYVHCIDAKGNLVWGFQAGGSGISGISVSRDGNMVVICSDAGVLFFDNLQVVGGILPKLRHQMTLAADKGATTFKAEKLFEEGVVALNYGDYQTTAQKILEMEGILIAAVPPAPPVPEPGIPTAGPPVDDEVATLQAQIDGILRGSEELKVKGIDVEPVENLLGDAMLYLEDGKVEDARVFAQDAREMLETFGGKVVPVTGGPAKGPETERPKDLRGDAMQALEKASKMLTDLEDTELNFESVKTDINMAKALMNSNEFQRAIVAANRAIITMEKALDPYITQCLVNVQKLLQFADKEGIRTDEVKLKLMSTGQQLGKGEYLAALDSVKEAEEWLEVALEGARKKKEVPPHITIPPVPSLGDIDTHKEPEGPTEPEEPETPTEPGEPETPTEPEEPETPTEPEEPETPTEPGEPETPTEPGEPETPTEPGEPETPTEPEEPETPTEVSRPPPVPMKPTVDMAKLAHGAEDPTKVLSEADEALNGGDIVVAIEKYLLTMEAVEGRARAVVEQTIDQAKEHIEKVKGEGFDVSDASTLVETAEEELASGDYKGAAERALLALERADAAAAEEILKVIDDSRKALLKAVKLGVEISMAEDLIKDAEEAVKRKDYNVAIEMATKTVEEVEKASVGFIEDIVAEGKTLVEKATEIGADVTEVRGQLDEVTAALEKKDFATANEKAKKAVETAKTLPKAFVQGIISEARTKVLAVDKLGADAMMAKNFLIKARSSLAAGDFTAALKACDKCMEELEKAPKALVNKRIALARTDMDYVRSTGQDTTALEQELSGAEAKVAEADFEGAIGIVQDITDRLKALKGLGQEVTNILFDADMSVAEAAEAGRDVKKAKGMVEEAFKLRATDPTKAKELALEAKKLLEQ